jgi:hypothetical protein
MKYLFLATLFFLNCLLPSCGYYKKLAETNKQTMDSWLGSHKSALIQSWGPPSRYESDGKGGEILVYEQKSTRGAVIGNTYQERTTYPYKMFYADKDGKIYYWRTGG